MKKVLIIGAGPAGLTAAYELLDAVEDLYGWQADPDVDIDLPVEPSLKIKGDKDIIKDYADRKGESVNGYINKAVEERMQRDGSGNDAADYGKD